MAGVRNIDLAADGLLLALHPCTPHASAPLLNPLDPDPHSPNPLSTLFPQFLDLSGNSISAQGCAAVAETLGSNSSVYALNLAGCPCRDEGAIAIAEALKSNIGLFRLDLTGCHVGDLRGLKQWLLCGPHARVQGCRAQQNTSGNCGGGSALAGPTQVAARGGAP
jgi:hypothetical protein